MFGPIVGDAGDDCHLCVSGVQGAPFVGHVQEGSRKPEQREEGVRPAV